MSSFKTVNQDYTITCNNGAGYFYVNAIFSVPSLVVNNIVANSGTFTGNVTSQGAGNGFIGNILTPAQPNITSLGTLTSLTVSPGLTSLQSVVAANIFALGTFSATSANLGVLNINNNIINNSTGDIVLDPTADGGVLGSVIILGNLYVQGNTTTVSSNTIAINSLLFQAANNASTASLANGAGLAVGPSGNSYATWTYASTSNAWTSNNAVIISGNITGTNIFGNGSALTSVNATSTVATVTFDGSGAGGASGTAFNGNVAQTISYNTVGAAAINGTNATGTWPISVSGTSPGLSGGGTGQIPYQSAANTTSFIAAPTASNQSLQWDGAGFTWATTVNQVIGTSNQVTVSGATGNVTLTLPQDIANTSNVQFGSLGIGTAASGLLGEIRAANNVTAFYASDSRFKENILPISDAVDKAVAIGGKTFDWTDKYISEHGGEDGYFVTKSDIGVIAQDVQRVLPQAVRTRSDGSLAVDYAKLSALAFAAIAELKAEIEVLKGKQ